MRWLNQTLKSLVTPNLRYKYTIASTYAAKDAVWADDMFSCSYYNYSHYNCEAWNHVGKTTCSTQDLHFVYNPNTPSGDMDVSEWDEYMIALNTKSYEKDAYNQFMNNNLMFYSYDLDTFVENLLKDDTDFLIRKSKVTGDADESYQVGPCQRTCSSSPHPKLGPYSYVVRGYLWLGCA